MKSPQSTPQSGVQPHIPDELILVVKRETLFPQGAWQGIEQKDCAAFAQLIRTHQEFLPRPRMETDPRYKQIIPYLVFTYEDKYFVMQRRANASEQRLQGKLSLGIGGHINAEDLAGATIVEWAQREFSEEVNYQGTYTITPFGVINDDSNDVGRVHLGFVYFLQGNSADISVKSELKSGSLLTLAECKEHYNAMESWSQMIIDALCDSQQ
jgi:predicted NUDIX family phosphoesterase